MAALSSDAIKISVKTKGGQESISTRLVYEEARFFDTGFLEDGYFEAGPGTTQASRAAWKHFLVQMSDGFKEGQAVIGGKAFSSDLTVKFSGNGLDSKLKELIAYCKK